MCSKKNATQNEKNAIKLKKIIMTVHSKSSKKYKLKFVLLNFASHKSNLYKDEYLTKALEKQM